MKEITILQLYTRDMNLYGDIGNSVTLAKRLRLRGYEPVIIDYNRGDEFPLDPDIIVGGGGQDSGQEIIQDDLLSIGSRLHELAADNTPMLMICGMYQLFGHYFETHEGNRIEGVGVLDVVTFGRHQRLTGNVFAESDEFGPVIGYENHSGQTFLGERATPLARVRKGAGNNPRSKTEGARHLNVIGTYLHGPVLPNNPAIADYLIEKAVLKRYGAAAVDELHAITIDDSLAEQVRASASGRSR